MNVFVAMMNDHVGEPDVDELGRFYEAYERALLPFSTDEQQTIADRVLEKPRKRWPSIGECLEIGHNLASRITPPDYTPTDCERLVTAHDRTLALLTCDLGRIAATNGWIGALWEFVLTHSRLPRDVEVHPLIQQAARQAAAFAADDTSHGRTVRRAVEGRNRTRAEKVLRAIGRELCVEHTP